MAGTEGVKGPLNGVRVVEIGTFVTAPLAAMMLADLGASVIKVENPDGGDPFRRGNAELYGANFVAYNHSKKCITLNLREPRGRDVLDRLLRRADVLIENYRPGVLDKFGFGDSRIATDYPQLIHCSITGFGKDGPYSKRPAYDTVGIALSGIASLAVDPENPRIVGPTVADNVTGMNACMGVLAALYARGKGKQARRVEVNMLESSIALIPDPIANFTQDGALFGPTSRVAASHTFAFRCSDGELLTVHLSVPEKFWTGLLEVLQATDTIGSDERFASRRSRIANYHILQTCLATIVAKHPRPYWTERLEAADIPFAPINTIADVMTDPQVQHLGVFHRVNHPRLGETICIRSPIRIDGERLDAQPAGALGEHSDEILQDLGYPNEELSAPLSNP